MGLDILGSFLVFALCFRQVICQQPNTDSFYVSDFLKKMGLNSPEIESSHDSFCDWEGVFCDSERVAVVKFVASGVGLSGVIPDNTIGKLSKIESLDLSNNGITDLPSDVWSLGSLKSFNLSKNQISGNLSSNIGNFGQLEILDLSFNSFSGGIPDSMSSLESLQVLDLRRNLFESKIPYGIMSCRSLVSLDLSGNKLSDSLHDDFGSAFPNLQFLNLAENEIHGKGFDFSGMVSLAHLNISGNSFNGSVLGVLQGSLKVIDLSRNQFEGHISEVNFSRLTALEYMNFSGNNLTGRIPGTLSSLTSLRALDLSRNHLSSQIPLLNTKKLQVLDVSFNNLSGEIPLELIDIIPSMERFNFSYNNLSFCASSIAFDIIQSAFIGSSNGCHPVAANPDFLKNKARKYRGLKLALALTISMVVMILGLLILAFGCRSRTTFRAVKLKPNSPKEELQLSFQTDSQANSMPVVIFEKPLFNLTLPDLVSATSNFDRRALLGEGRFGCVYRAVLPSGTHTAVEVLACGSTVTDQEAARELEFLGRVKHPNIVPMEGYCFAGDQRFILYHDTGNGHLQSLLHDPPPDVQMDWIFRHKIALGTARALAFLHHGCSPPIIHGDIKSSSVYLDMNLDPRLSGFGLAKLFGRGLEDDSTNGSPECIGSPKEVTPKHDVYGFGVILFELITAKKPIGDDYPEAKDNNLVSWVRGLVRENEGSRAIDPNVRGLGPEPQMVEALKIGYLCTAEHPSKRPSMQQIVGLLKDIQI